MKKGLIFVALLAILSLAAAGCDGSIVGPNGGNSTPTPTPSPTPTPTPTLASTTQEIISGKIEIPVGGQLSASDIAVASLSGEGQVDSSGGYTAPVEKEDINLVGALNTKNDEVVYFSIQSNLSNSFSSSSQVRLSIRRQESVSGARLGPTSTAISMVFQQWPFHFLTTQVADAMLTYIAQQPEIDGLASAIEASVKKNGYIVMSEVGQELGNTVKTIVDRFLSEDFTKSGSIRRGTLGAPSVTPQSSQRLSIVDKSYEVATGGHNVKLNVKNYSSAIREINALDGQTKIGGPVFLTGGSLPTVSITFSNALDWAQRIYKAIKNKSGWELMLMRLR
jgi:hypothetical protein